MIIGYKKDLDGILRAAIALKANPGSTMVCGRTAKELDQKLSQYHGDTVVNVDDIIKNVPFHIKASLWVKSPTCGRSQRTVSLGGYLGYALRHSKCVPDDLVKLLAYYYPNLIVILAHKDTVAKKYYHMYREVGGELERMKAHTRFRPAGDLMYVEIYPKHDVEDLYLEWAARRNSDRSSVVKCNTSYWIVNARYIGYRSEIASISKEEAKRLLGHIPSVEDEVWDTFYDSQAIENRRNKKYAKKMLPAKYSHISPEVRMERKKIEHGISKNKLDEFFND